MDRLQRLLATIASSEVLMAFAYRIQNHYCFSTLRQYASRDASNFVLDNGQTIPFAKDTICPDFCCVAAALHIWHRALRLNIDPTTPLAVFVSTKSSTPQFITNVHVTQLLKEAATAAQYITRKVDLARFTAHSIRVGAYVLLHSQGATAELIKLRLRWRSDAFMFYLRNIIALAEHHRDVLRNA